MKTISSWSAIVIIGIVVILAGIIISYSGLETQFKQTKDVNTEYVYSYKMEAPGGKPIHVLYNLSVGNMTVLIISETGFSNLSNPGTYDPEKIHNQTDNTTNGEINWTPESNGTYYVVFYDFSEEDSSLDIEVSFYGMDTTRFFVGIIVVAIGILIAMLGIILRKKQSISEQVEKPQEDTVSESSHEPSTEETAEPKEPPQS